MCFDENQKWEASKSENDVIIHVLWEKAVLEADGLPSPLIFSSPFSSYLSHQDSRRKNGQEAASSGSDVNGRLPYFSKLTEFLWLWIISPHQTAILFSVFISPQIW